MVPLDFLVPSFGRCSFRFEIRDEGSSPLIEDDELELAVVEDVDV